jgi:hypothetical protein
MTEAWAGSGERMEFEIRGGVWEGVHALIFYAAVTLAVLTTLGVMRLAFGIAFIVCLFYSMFAIFSSPTYIVIDPGGRGLTLERYHYFIPSRRRIAGEELETLEVVESSRLPAAEGKRGSRHDLSYYVRVYLKLKDGSRFKLFRSGMTGSPADNRGKAYLIVQAMSGALEIPVSYTRRGLRDGHTEDHHGA